MTTPKYRQEMWEKTKDATPPERVGNLVTLEEAMLVMAARDKGELQQLLPDLQKIADRICFHAIGTMERAALNIICRVKIDVDINVAKDNLAQAEYKKPKTSK